MENELQELQPQAQEPGRKPWTEEQKRAAAQAERKKKADSMKPEFIIQYAGADTTTAEIEAAAIADFRQAKKRTSITSLKIYIKPEERMAYYVINEQYTGSVSI